MANWRSYIDPSVGDGQNTLDGIIANGPTYGIGISDDLSVTGLSTFSDIARFSGTIRLDGELRDGDNNFGSSGQVLSSDGNDTRWVNAAQLSAGAAAQIAINADNSTNASRFLTFVNSSSGNNDLKTDTGLTYNPSSNDLLTTGDIVSGRTSGGVALTINDGYGNANVTWNHQNGVPEQNGNAARIEVNTDSTSGATMFFELKSNVTGGSTTALTSVLDLLETQIKPHKNIIPNSDSSINIGSNSVRFANGYFDTLTGNLTGNVTGNASGSSGSCTGNAATATTLQTSRTIGGVSFNGSANINLPGVNQDGNQNTSGNAATATVLETTRNFSISGEITANAQSFNGSGNVTLSATVDDNIIDYNNLKASNRTSATNGQYLRKRSGNTGGMTWEDIPVVTGGNLTGNTLASGIVNSSLTSLGTLSGLTVNGTVSGTANISLTGGNHSKIECGRTSGSVAMTINDGYGNANLAFNHASGTPDINGSACRIETAVDNTTGSFNFEIGNSVTSGSAVTLTDTLYFTTSTITYKGNTMWHAGNDGPSSGLNADLLDGEEGTYYRNAGNLNAGTIPNARFPSTLPTISGQNLTSLNASNISSGTIAAARLPNHSASLLTSGTIPAARVPTLNQNTTGSAATLTTARTIAGSSFNGSANISINYNNLTNKPTIPTNNNQLTNGRGFITATDVRSMNEATSTGTSSTTSSVMQDKVTLSISTVSNSRVLVLFGFEIQHSRNNNASTTARVTGDNISFVGGNYQVTHSNQTFTEFQGQRLDISSHTGTRTYKIQWSRNQDTGSIRNAYLVAIEMSV